mmetsp:Transcript_13086/g.39579  ORF Transcript_13086/g.39579 Transcript_13086/m.39579 type:complete len:86 (+) Transcript_13086:555-812(+)
MRSIHDRLEPSLTCPRGIPKPNHLHSISSHILVQQHSLRHFYNSHIHILLLSSSSLLILFLLLSNSSLGNKKSSSNEQPSSMRNE